MQLMAWLDLYLGVLTQMFSSHKEAEMSLITVTWDHAVNSKAKLRSALASSANMIEADVITGHLIDEPEGGEKTDRIPIMGHPPAITSDLSLQEFLEGWNRTDKILKLDFKSTESFMLALPLMENMFKDLPTSRLPWLNADILPGPGPGGSPGMDADTFLGESTKSFPDSILSLGWTTKRNDNDAYTENYINAMVDVLLKNKYMKPVTYAVRASFAANSITELQYLLETSPVGSTLTVWCSDPEDKLDYLKLIELVNTIGEKRVYLDLPDDKSKKFFNMYVTNDSARTSRNIGVYALSLASLLVLKNIFI